MKGYIYSNYIFNCCSVCEHQLKRAINTPCDGCRKRVKPKKPLKELYVNEIKYILDEDDTE